MARQHEYSIKVGQQVECCYGYGRPSPGVVEKIGRTLVHIRVGGSLTAYKLDGQQARQDHNSYFQTLDQKMDRDRRNTAIKKLRELGLELRIGYATNWSTNQLLYLWHHAQLAKQGAPLPPEAT